MERAENLWRVTGSFGAPAGEVTETETGYRYDGGGYRLEITRETDENGVCLQSSALKNTSDAPIEVGCLLSRFVLPGGEYEVYAQTNVQLAESVGAWQPLHTGISVRCPQMRRAFGAAPMAALWNEQTGRGVVYHLFATGAWEITATREGAPGGKQRIGVELGLDPRQTRLTVAPGGTLRLPDVLYYAFTCKRDLDCHKLHAWLNRNMPRRELPVLYNTWLYRFDKLTADGVLAQIERAKALGAEYFTVDAGWYGPRANWTTTRGDWEERPDGALDGRLAEISGAVRAAGMGFGFWLEAETASPAARIVAEHPEYFFERQGKIFLNFADANARRYLLDTTCALVEKYHATFLKFDFNQDVDFDPSGTAFTAFHAGCAAYLAALRERFPGIYLEGCASGGMRMTLADLREYDSFWLSDNQSPYHGLRIVRETMLRLAPQAIERWVVARSAQDFQPDYTGKTDKLFACNDSTWQDVRSVRRSYYKAFLTGGIPAFSCDLTALSDGDFAFFRDCVEEWKRDRAFWQGAVGRILCDTKTLLALQYSDEALREVRVLTVPQQILQKTATVCPVLDAQTRYTMDGETRTGAQWMASGVTHEKLKPFELRESVWKAV